MAYCTVMISITVYRNLLQISRNGYYEKVLYVTMAYPGILFGGGRGSTNSVEDRGQRERGLGAVAP